MVDDPKVSIPMMLRLVVGRQKTPGLVVRKRGLAGSRRSR
jgi:hypothetical protein